ncbi:unnamed protein product [Enterobius vermicularis]|uniref:BHLH domain-containing protein n=1 Tax=Enterobius vermicularis TaxID=51028 RepID=A0A0N4V132_ENTVE|nr:unnamed protein product [Enterobius vermicularis]
MNYQNCSLYDEQCHLFDDFICCFICSANKPLMEKKRRARINRCLYEMKQMLVESAKNSTSHSKWEKADILEMSVAYIKQLQSQARKSGWLLHLSFIYHLL